MPGRSQELRCLCNRLKDSQVQIAGRLFGVSKFLRLMGGRASLKETVRSLEPKACRAAEQWHLQSAPVRGDERVGDPTTDDIYYVG